MKRIALSAIIISSIAFANIAKADFSSFLSKATKATETVSSAADSSLSKEQQALADQLATACSEFATAKSKAYAAVGNSQESDKYASISETIKSEKNLETLANYLDAEKSSNALSVVKSIETPSNDQKTLILESLQSFYNGVNEEVELGKDLADTATAAADALKSASGLDKIKLAADLKPLMSLSKRFPQDLQNAKDALTGYMDFAKQNGIDVSSMAASLKK